MQEQEIVHQLVRHKEIMVEQDLVLLLDMEPEVEAELEELEELVQDLVEEQEE
jgi:hypothetical protein